MTVRVLIVDDQEPFRMAARMVVEATDGFDVVGEAETGEDSVAMAAELAPDLVLMDVNLPGINGLDATRQILAGASDGSTAVVVLLLSTYEEEEYAPRAAECGAFRIHPEGRVRPRPPRSRLGRRDRRRLTAAPARRSISLAAANRQLAHVHVGRVAAIRQERRLHEPDGARARRSGRSCSPPRS